MKQTLLIAASILVLTGCHTYQGSPGQDGYRDTGSDRRTENKATDNMHDVGRQTSPTSPFNAPNGARNF